MFAGTFKAKRMIRAVTAAAGILLCMQAAWARGQHGGAPASASHSAPAPHASAAPRGNAPANRAAQPRNLYPRNFNQGPAGSAARRPAPNSLGNNPRAAYPPPNYAAPGNPGSAYPGPPYLGPSYARPAYPGFAPPAEGPPGHLGDWLNQHRNLPITEQERVLRGDPSFRRLPSADQQRVIEQLHQVNQLNGGAAPAPRRPH